MKLFDFHTHHDGLQEVVSLRQGTHSWGVHPWNAGEESTELPPGAWMAIGECGLDKLCGKAMDLQVEVFREMVRHSEENQLPLILHCVKSHAELLLLQKELHATMPWICHGFRGKPEQMQQLLRCGWFLSFGERFNEGSVKLCPLHRLLIETDDSLSPIQDTYERIARIREVSVENLARQMECNYEFLFGKSPFSPLSS